MALTPDQTQFIKRFVSEGAYDFMEACAYCGVAPSTVLRWMQDSAFLAAVRAFERNCLLIDGFGPMRVVRELMAIAFSDVTEVRTQDGMLDHLPRRVRAAIRKVEFKTDQNIVTGELKPYVRKVELYDKTQALKLLADWYAIADSPEVKATKVIKDDENAPRRITGLVVRPPLTVEDEELERMLS
jgi:hypothetical protein